MDGDLARQVRAADRDRYLATLYAPEDRRAALFALYAFDAETAQIRDRVSEPLPGEIRLQWWRDAIASPDAGAGHPLATALAKAMREHRLPASALDRLIEARIVDLYDDPMPDRTALEAYLGETEGAIIQIAALVLTPDDAVRFGAAAGHAGCARGIARLLRMLPLHRARGQCYVPADILAATGSSRDELVAGGAGARNAVAAMAALGREHLAAFERAARDLPAALRPAYLPLATTAATLERTGRLADPFQPSPPLSEIRRQWLIFRAARRGWK